MTQEGESWSIFTHNTVRVTDQLDFVFGARWIDETKDGRYEQVAASQPGMPQHRPERGQHDRPGPVPGAAAG